MRSFYNWQVAYDPKGGTMTKTRKTLFIGFITFAAIITIVVLQSTSRSFRRLFRSGPVAEFSQTFLDLGEVPQGKTIEHVFVVENAGSQDLHIERVVSANIIDFDKIIAPGKDGKIRLGIKTENRKGGVQALAQVYSNDPEQPTTVLQLRARVVAPVDVLPQDRVYFLDATKGQKEEQELTIVNAQDKPLKIRQVTSNNPVFQARLEPLQEGTRYKLVVGPDPNAAAGKYEGQVVVTTDSPEYPSLVIELRALIRDVVSASPSPVDFSQILLKDVNQKPFGQKIVVVKKYQGKDFQISRAMTDVPYIDVEVVPEKPGESFFVNLNIVQSRARKGDIQGTLTIETNDPAFPQLKVPITGKIF
jgi:uncharacterized protein DUF1573